MKTDAFGIIINVECGIEIKYDDYDTVYLRLDIITYDGWHSSQFYRYDRIKEVLNYFGCTKINQLIHKRVIMGQARHFTENPRQIRLTYKEEWIENDNTKLSS